MRKTKSLRVVMFLFCFSTLALTFSCGNPDNLEKGSSDLKIRGGEVSFQPATGYISFSTGYRCSAALIAPNAVLTAQHCLTGKPNVSGTSGSLDKGLVRVFFPKAEKTPLNSEKYFYRAEGVRFWSKKPAEKPYSVIDDIAIIWLDRSLDITPVKLSQRKPKLFEKLTLAGYGRTDCTRTDNGSSMNFQQYKADYLWSTTDLVGCPGDSGGPHFDATGELIAVHSGSIVVAGLAVPIAPYHNEIIKLVE
ncbi:MAG: S1 family peptidase [Oligoflexales bacterium]|nr:S1 family peptidase [Oligoflexales bacterium]